MSYCREEGKDRLIFATEEDHSSPSNIVLPEDGDEYEGLISASGEINWDCPCLQGMADGPCGENFKSAFSCFHYSDAEIKGSDCVPQFRDMQICFSKYPEIYGNDEEEKEENSDTLEEKLNSEKSETSVESSSQNNQISHSSENVMQTPQGGSEGGGLQVSSSI